MTNIESVERDRGVRLTLCVEGFANLIVLLVKTWAGLSTGSFAILSDAVHSLADLGNNALALVAQRLAREPPDRDHPYGHRKFESLAVFVLATLLAVLAIEIPLRSIGRDASTVTQHGWGLAAMLGVLAVNSTLALWEGWRAHRLDSDLLRADASHTASDVFTTIATITGWQFAASGTLWVDSVASFAVAGLILLLAYRLFRHSIPVLVDRAVADPDEVAAALLRVSGVHEARRVRSRTGANGPRIDVVISVAPELATRDSHAIADTIERVVREQFGADEVNVHVEPDACSRIPHPLRK